VQAEVAEREREDLADGTGREAAAVPRAVYPVADRAAFGAVTDDPEDVDCPGDRVAVEDRERVRLAVASWRCSRSRWPSVVKNSGGRTGANGARNSRFAA
jgi:hypothetical protein